MPILHWLSKQEAISKSKFVPYRLLELNPSLSYHKEPNSNSQSQQAQGSNQNNSSNHEISKSENLWQRQQNFLIQGDNLEGLKALLPYFAAQVKCIYIDPPYNTGSAFEHYDDNLEHSKWLSMIYPRLELLRELLAEDGSIWISIDDDEAHYLKVACDEIFGRGNFVSNFVWEKKRKPSFLSKVGTITENILCYAKNKSAMSQLVYGKISDEETYPLYNSGNARKVLKFPKGTLNFLKHEDGLYGPREFQKETSLVRLLSDLIIAGGKNENEVLLEGEWRYSQKAIDQQFAINETYVIKSLDFRPRRVLNSQDKGKKIHNLISRFHYNIDTYEDSANESSQIFNDNSFNYPKPEALIHFIISVASKEGDLILDSFLGSGTTAAVAHKMNRRWIGIEMGEHAKTHCAVRLQKVIDGEQGGISKELGWQGGGGFSFYELGEAIFDEAGKINPKIKFEHLAAHIWFCETKNPHSVEFSASRQNLRLAEENLQLSPFLGNHNETAYFLLFNGILGDKSVSGGNVLTSKTLAILLGLLPDFTDPKIPKIIYGEASRLGASKLKEQNITFKQTPYDIKAR